MAKTRKTCIVCKTSGNENPTCHRLSELKRTLGSSTLTASSRTVTIPETDNQSPHIQTFSLLSSPKKFLIERVIEGLPESREDPFKNSFSTKIASSRTLTTDIVFGSLESSPEEPGASLTERCTALGLKRKFEASDTVLEEEEENFPSVFTPSSPGISNIKVKKRKLNIPLYFGDMEYEDTEDPNSWKICWDIIN